MFTRSASASGTTRRAAEGAEVAARRAATLPELHALHCFVSVAELRSVRQAALRLGLSNSAVSQALAALEQRLGVVLLDRGQRPLQLTPGGQRLLPQVRALLSQARGLVATASSGAGSMVDDLRMGCVDSFAATIGPELVRGLEGLVRDVHLYSGITPHISAQLLRREMDVAVCTDPLAQSPHIRCQALFAEAWVAVFPKAHGPERIRSLRDLARLPPSLPLLRYSLRSVIGTQIERFLGHVGAQVPCRHQFDATDPLLALVAAGAGWALTSPLCLLQSRHHLQAVRVLPLPASAEGWRRFYLLWHEDTPLHLGRDIEQMCRQVLRQRIVPAFGEAVPRAGALFSDVP